MAEFLCKVGTPGGEVVERTFNADDEAALRVDLERQDYYVFSIRRAGGSAARLRRQRVRNDTLLLFSQELAALLKAGLPLLQALDVMLERQKDLFFKASLAQVRERVKSGTSLSDAFRAEAERYPPIFAASIVAGERSGNLEGVLRRFVQYLRLSQLLKKKAISASVYPAAVITMMIALVFVMLVKVVPAFEGFYQGFNAELPLVTRTLLSLSKWTQAGLPWIVLTLAGGVLAAVAWLRRERSMEIVDRTLLKVPYFGRLMRLYAISQLARTLSTLLSGGLPLLSAMEIASASVGNRAMAAAVAQATPLIREGKSLTTSLDATHMLDNVALEMVKVGEQTGALGDMLNAIAEFFDEELDTQIARVLVLVEPVMLVMMAVVVATMLLAFYLPMFQIFATLSR